MTPRLALLIVLLVVVVAFLIQNAAMVAVHFLFWRIILSQSLVVFLAVVFGFLAGVTVMALRRRTRGDRR